MRLTDQLIDRTAADLHLAGTAGVEAVCMAPDCYQRTNRLYTTDAGEVWACDPGHATEAAKHINGRKR